MLVIDTTGWLTDKLISAVSIMPVKEYFKLSEKQDWSKPDGL